MKLWLKVTKLSSKPCIKIIGNLTLTISSIGFKSFKSKFALSLIPAITLVPNKSKIKSPINLIYYTLYFTRKARSENGESKHKTLTLVVSAFLDAYLIQETAPMLLPHKVICVLSINGKLRVF